MTGGGALPTPALILAADHRARAVLTTENWAEFFGSLAKSLPACDGILATAQPLEGLAAAGHVTPRHRTYLSLNRTGLAGSVFELDDRLVASVGRAASDGWTGIKHMTRIDFDDPLTAPALELLGQVLEQARAAGLEALVEPLRVARGPDPPRHRLRSCWRPCVAHDMGAPVIKVPVPAVAAGRRAPARGGPGGGERGRARPLPRRAASPRGGATPSSTRCATSWRAEAPGWRWGGRSTRTPTRPRWRASSPRWCTHDDDPDASTSARR